MAGIGSSGGSSQQTSQPSDINFLNPVTAVIANMFGIPVSLTPEGGLKYGGSGTTMGAARANSPWGWDGGADSGKASSYGPMGGFDFGLSAGPTGNSGKDAKGGYGSFLNNGGGNDGYFANQIFGPGSFEAIRDFLTESNIFGDQSREMNQLGLDAAEDTISNIGQVNEGLMALPERVGKPIDIQPLLARLGTDMSEQFAASGGFSGSDFENAVMRAGGELAVGEERDALGRFMEATLGAAPLIGTLGTAASEPGQRSAGNALSFGEQYNLSSATPQGRASSLHQMLAGITPTGAIPRGNYSQGSSKNFASGGQASVGG